MEYSEIRADYLKVRLLRLETLLQRTHFFRPPEIQEFLLLEDGMNSGEVAEGWLRSFHASNDNYLRLLDKVLDAAVKIGEPHAEDKRQAFIEEKGTMGPAVFLTPWDITLAYLDKTIGYFDDVAKFYGFDVSETAA